MILPALKRKPPWLRLPDRNDLKRPLLWLILIALIIVLASITMMAYFAFTLASPAVSRYGGDVSARTSADYGFWPFGSLIPPLNPDAASASEQDAIISLAPEGPDLPPATAVPVVVVAAATATPTPPRVTTVPSPSPSSIVVAVAPSPLPTRTAVPAQQAPTQAILPTRTPRPAVMPAPSVLSTNVPVVRLDPPEVLTPAPSASTPTALPTASPPLSTPTNTTPPPQPPITTPIATVLPPSPTTSIPTLTVVPTRTPLPLLPPTPVPPVLSFANAMLTVKEEAGRAVFTLRLSKEYFRSISVPYSTGGGTAIAGVDYRALSGTLSFAPGETQKDLVIELLRNQLNAPAKTVELRIGSGLDVSISGPSVGVLTIVDNDPPPVVRFVGASRTVAEDVKSVGLTFALSAPSGSPVEVPYTISGTADAADHSLRGGTVIFPPGATSMRLRFDIMNDALDEDDETVIINLGDPVNATLGSPGSYTLTITDDDTSAVNLSRTSFALTEAQTGGHTASYVVVLNSQPTHPVTVVFSADAQLRVLPTRITFQPADWSQARTVTIFVVDDDFDELTPHFGSITHSATSSDPRYSQLTISPAIVTITDNDTAGITLTAASTSLHENPREPNHSTTYSVVLNSRPTAAVSVTMSFNPAQLALSTNQLVFAPDDWRTPQTVTVTTVQNAIDQGASYRATISHAAASSDPYYDDPGAPFAPRVLTFTIADDDTAGLLLTPSGPLRVNEGGSTSYKLRLMSEPTASVTVTLTGAIVNTASLSVTPELTFTTSNWNQPQPVTITVADDAVDQADPYSATVSHSLSSADPYYADPTAPFAPYRIDVAVIDNDAAGITRTLIGPLSVNEGGSTSYALRLTSKPLNDVMVALNQLPAGVVVVAVEPSALGLRFTPTNWDTVRTITLNTIDNSIDDGDRTTTISHTVTSADPLYAAQTVANLTVTVQDDDVAGITPNLINATSFTEGGTITYTLRLNSEPLDDVIVNLAASPADGLTLSQLSLTFAPGRDWDRAQTITISATDNFINDGDRTTTISHTVTSADPLYAVQTVADLTVTVQDDDVAGITRTPSGPLSVNEGGTITYTLRLNSEPLDDVIVNLAASPADGLTLSQLSLTFAPGRDWDRAQTITISATDNSINDGDRTATISHIVTSADPLYAAQTVADLTITVKDDDTAGVTLTEASTSLHEDPLEPNHSTTYSVVLNSRPTAAVSVTMSFNPAQLALSTNQLVFAPADWNTPLTVTVTVVPDLIDQGASYRATISHTAASADPNYNDPGAPFAPPTLTFTITDDDTAGVTLAPMLGNLLEAGETTGSFGVRLLSEPVAPVTLTLSQDGQLRTLSPPTLVFNASNWNAFQLVSVQAKDDAIAEAAVHSSTILLTGSGDPNYATTWAYSVSIEDNDLAGLEVLTPDGKTTSEAGPAVRLSVRLTSQPTAPVTVSVSSSDLTEATVSVDAPATLPLVFNASNWATPVEVTVTGVDDGVYDGPQPYTLTVAVARSPDPIYAALVLVTTRFTNTDNEVAFVTLGDAPAQLESSARLRFPISISAPPLGLVEVDYETMSLSAQAGEDFTATAGTFTFAPASPTSGFIEVPISNDGFYEPDELLAVRLSALRVTALDQVELRDRQGVGQILNDDLPGVRFRVANLAVARGSGQTVPIEVVLDAPLASTARVNYSTIGGGANAGTADPGIDYTMTSGTLSFAPGVTSQSFNLELLANAGPNALTETIKIELSVAVGMQMSKPDELIVTMYDLPLGDPLVPAEPPLEFDLNIGAPLAGVPATVPLNLSYAHGGLATASDAVITVSLPLELTPTAASCAMVEVTCSPGPPGEPHLLVLNLGRLAAGASGTFALEANLDDNVGGIIAVAAEARYRDTANIEYRKRVVTMRTLP